MAKHLPVDRTPQRHKLQKPQTLQHAENSKTYVPWPFLTQEEIILVHLNMSCLLLPRKKRTPKILLISFQNGSEYHI